MEFSLGLPAAPAVRSMVAWMAGLDFMFAHSSAGLRRRQVPEAYDRHLMSLGGGKSSPSDRPLQPPCLWACCLGTGPELGGTETSAPGCSKGGGLRMPAQFLIGLSL